MAGTAAQGGNGATRGVLATPADNGVIDAWLTRRTAQGINAANLTAAHIQRIETEHGYTHDTQGDGIGNSTLTDHATGVAIAPAAVGFAAVDGLGEKAFSLLLSCRLPIATIFPYTTLFRSRGVLATPADNGVIDAWLTRRTAQGINAANLTAAHIQ